MPYDQAIRIFEIQSAVGKHLVRQGVLQKPLETTIRKLSMEAWGELSDSLLPFEQSLTYIRQRDGERFRQTLPVYWYGELLVAGRVNRLNRVVVYIAADLEELIQRVGQDLQYYGAIDDPSVIETRAVEPAAVSGTIQEPA